MESAQAPGRPVAASLPNPHERAMVTSTTLKLYGLPFDWILQDLAPGLPLPYF